MFGVRDLIIPYIRDYRVNTMLIFVFVIYSDIYFGTIHQVFIDSVVVCVHFSTKYDVYTKYRNKEYE